MKKYVFNPKTLVYEVVREPGIRRFLKALAYAVLGVGLFLFYMWMFTSVLGQELPKTAFLKKTNAEWKSKLEVLDRQLDVYDATLDGIEERNNHVYRSIFGLNEIPEEVMNSGLGGVNRYGYLDESGASRDLKDIAVKVDVMEKRAYVQSKALDEVEVVSRKAGDMVSHIPAVPPVVPDKSRYRLTSPFGYRVDPVYGGRRFHAGMDFAGNVGLPIYATGDGVVKSVLYQFTGYGNEVVIDHGFGYSTRYAHLSSITVTQGLEVKRGDKIGELGKSGKATGPHLHYEVLYRGNPTNPYSYMDLTMPVAEYRAMVDRRMREAGYLGTNAPSTGAILRRRRR